MDDEKAKEINEEEPNMNTADNEGPRYLPVSMSLGICLGCLLGILLHNIAMWAGLGITFGIAFGAIIDGQRGQKDS